MQREDEKMFEDGLLQEKEVKSLTCPCTNTHDLPQGLTPVPGAGNTVRRHIDYLVPVTIYRVLVALRSAPVPGIIIAPNVCCGNR